MPETASLPLMEFIDPDPEWRYRLPWRAGEYVCATDGRMCVRANPECWDGELLDVPFRKPNLDDVLRAMPQVATWSSLPEFPTCDKCRGRILIVERCPICRFGQCDCNCGHRHTCEFCKGTGRHEYDCECTVLLGNRTLRRRAVNKIAKLPGVEWGVADESPESIVFFRFVGGVGGVMPILVSEAT